MAELADRFRMACAEGGYPHVKVYHDDEAGFSWSIDDTTPPPEVIWRALRLVRTDRTPCRECWVHGRTDDDCAAVGEFVEDCGVAS